MMAIVVGEGESTFRRVASAIVLVSVLRAMAPAAPIKQLIFPGPKYRAIRIVNGKLRVEE